MPDTKTQADFAGIDSCEPFIPETPGDYQYATDLAAEQLAASDGLTLSKLPVTQVCEYIHKATTRSKQSRSDKKGTR
jgi:hypothetical protein